MSVHDSYQRQNLTLKREVCPKKLNKMVCKLLGGNLFFSDLGKYIEAKILPRWISAMEICQEMSDNENCNLYPSPWLNPRISHRGLREWALAPEDMKYL